MAGATKIGPIVGNLAGDPESRQAGSQTAVSFTVVVNERKKQGDEWVDGEPSYFRCTAWGSLGDNVVASCHKGDRVVVDGTIAERAFTTKEGDNRRVMEVTADEVAPSLKFATAAVTRGNSGGGRQQGGRQQRYQEQPAARPQQDAWAAYDENTPF